MTNLNQNGRSMIEMLGVLAIIGVLSVGGIAGYSKAMMKFKTNKTIDQISMTVTNIRTLYAQQDDYTGLLTTNAYAMGVTDDAMGTTGSKLVNPFGGFVAIKSAKNGSAGEGNKNRAFEITFFGLPREACVAIATNDWGSGYSSGLLGIGTGVEAASATPAAGGGQQQGSILNLLFSDAYAAVTQDTDSNAQNIPCDVDGNATNGGTKGSLINENAVACAIGNTSAALSVAKAATGCACGSANKCVVSLKYY